MVMWRVQSGHHSDGMRQVGCGEGVRAKGAEVGRCMGGKMPQAGGCMVTPRERSSVNLLVLVQRPGINWTGRVPRFRAKSALICVYRRLMNCFRELSRATRRGSGMD